MNVKLFLILLALFVFASPIFAAEATPEANYHWVAITAGFSMAIATAGCGIAQAKAVAAAAEGMGRNPGASAAIRGRARRTSRPARHLTSRIRPEGARIPG